MRSYRVALALIVAGIGIVSLTVLAKAEMTQKGNLRLSIIGRLTPRRLPRMKVAPIAVSVGWKISTTDLSPVPKLQMLTMKLNRHGRFDYAGLPDCPYARIQPASSSRALANCRSALVGQGTFSAEIGLKGQESYLTQGRLLVFNGNRHGRPVLYGQIYSPHPFATSFVIIFTVKTVHHGTYGTVLTAALPKALSSWGTLTGVEMRLARRFTYQGHSHSFLSAPCPAPEGFTKVLFPLARTLFRFQGKVRLSSVSAASCEVGR